MPYLETCKLATAKDIERLKKKEGMTQEQAVEAISKEAGIPASTLKSWIYYEKRKPKLQQRYRKSKEPEEQFKAVSKKLLAVALAAYESGWSNGISENDIIAFVRDLYAALDWE